MSRAYAASLGDWKTTNAYNFLNLSFLLTLMEVMVPNMEKISLRSLSVFRLET